MTRPLSSSTVTPVHESSGSSVLQFAASVQSAPPVASYSASSASRSLPGPAAPAVVTSIAWVALRPSGSLAVTVTVAAPAVPGASQTVAPDVTAVTATALSDTAA